MARMIPPVPAPDIRSSAEEKLFRQFRDAGGTENWTVLHSLGVSNHCRVAFGEVDFLVLAPGLGVFALEVKGGRVRRENGIWYFTNRYNETSSRVRSPVEQAREGMYSVRSHVLEHADAGRRHAESILFGAGVMMPDIVFDAPDIELEQWQVFDVRDRGDVRGYVRRLAEGTGRTLDRCYGPGKLSRAPDEEDVRWMASLLRGSFDCVVRLDSQIRLAEKQLTALTQEQYQCLDAVEDNPRCLIYGPAGTGKTLLAVEGARRAAAAGERTALFCYNAGLADWLKRQFLDLPAASRPRFAGTLHQFMRQTVPEMMPPKEDRDDFFESRLPEAAAERLQSPCFDRIIADEGQDLLRDSFLDVMDRSLAGGLRRGRWTMFGDFSMQAIYTEVSGSELTDRLARRADFARLRLTVNCRNTRNICQEIETVTGVSFRQPPGLTAPGPAVEYLTWSDPAEEAEKMDRLLQHLREQKVRPEDIVILSPVRRGKSAAGLLRSTQVKDFKAAGGGAVRFCTVHGFKGLESRVVILADIASFENEKLAYVGMSRATAALYVMVSKQACSEYNSLFLRRRLNGGHQTDTDH